MSETRKISRATYLQALGLYTLAAAKMKVVEDCERELAALFGLDLDNSHFSDELYARGGGSFEDALERSGIEVSEE